MTTPVLWVSRHYDEGVLCRGDKADQALLEAIFDRSLWRPPGALDFEHIEAPASKNGGTHLTPSWRKLTGGRGAVVVIPSRDHEGDEQWLSDKLSGLDWAVVMLTSNEEWKFDWGKLEGERRRFWVWQARPEHQELSGKMPCGWYPGTREGLKAGRPLGDLRHLDWFFAGQVTHERRQDCFAVLHRMEKKGLTKGGLYPTEGYLHEALPRAEYLNTMSWSKTVPCPSGPESLCTARVEEALEAGCVPIVDMLKPHDPQFDYWANVFGDHPMPTIRDWSQLPGVMGAELGKWPANANRCWAWWQQRKREMAWHLDGDIRACAEEEGPTAAWLTAHPDDAITVIVTTSPCRRHPDTSHIEQTIESIRAQLPDAEIVVTCDGVRPEQEELREAYEAYLHRLFWLTNFAWHNVVPVRLEQWGHQALAMKAALKLVRTPQVLFVEHDTPLEGPIDWPGVCGLVMSGEANLVRFAEDTQVHPDHEFLFLDHETRLQRGVPVRRTWAWQARPHVASTRFWRERIMPHFPSDAEKDHRSVDPALFCRTFIEDPLYGLILTQRKEHGDAAWWDWRMFMYAPDEHTDPQLGHKRHRHINSRGDEPKYDIWGFRQ